MKKRLMALALCGVMGASLLTGCGSSAKETAAATTAAATEAAKTEAATTAAAAETEKKEAKGSVYYLNFKPEQDAQWQELAKAYTEETGVPVTVVTAASGNYETTLMSEMGKSGAPTLFQVNGPVGLANWKDYCYDLSGSDVYGELTSDGFALKDGDAVEGIAYVIESYGIITNKTLLEKAGYTVDDIKSFDDLKKVAEDITARSAELGFSAFSSAGMDGSSDWRFKTHLANLPIYFEYQEDGIGATDAIKGTYLDNYRAIWDLYINNSTCAPAELAAKTGDDSRNEFLAGKAVFFQNGSWEYGNLTGDGKFTDDDLTMIPIYVGAGDEANQGLCTGTENYWCVNGEAEEDDIQATLDFMYWCVTSELGTNTMANEMGFVIPFKKAAESPNLFVKVDKELTAAGKNPVSWNFTTMPSEEWKNGVGSALTAYAADQTDANWDAVVKAFVDGWATEYALANP
ncbi:MAG: ABC transporter substrate-binding protein [Lachnospiraceae bacterium]|nr:ABC transporter substrate-binding protein [Lachnospiraceae bacterium]